MDELLNHSKGMNFSVGTVVPYYIIHFYKISVIITSIIFKANKDLYYNLQLIFNAKQAMLLKLDQSKIFLTFLQTFILENVCKPSFL